MYVDFRSSVVSKDHELLGMVWEVVSSEILNLHIIVLDVNERLIVHVKVLKVAVIKTERGKLGRITAYSASKIIQVEEHCVSQVVKATRIKVEEFITCWLSS